LAFFTKSKGAGQQLKLLNVFKLLHFLKKQHQSNPSDDIYICTGTIEIVSYYISFDMFHLYCWNSRL
jgi:hypothetical protein